MSLASTVLALAQAAGARIKPIESRLAMLNVTPALARVQLILRAIRPFRVVYLGSSTTAGTAATTNANRWVNRFTTYLQGAYPSGLGSETTVVGLATGASAPSGNAGVHGYNGGIGGTTSANFAPSDTLSSVQTLQPALITVMVGANDIRTGVSAATYAANMQAAIAAIRGVMTRPFALVLFQTYMPYDATYDPAVWAAYGQALAAIAAADTTGNTYYHDLSGAFAKAGIPSVDTFGMMSSDKIHMNDAGHAYMADQIRARLDIPNTPVVPVALADTTPPSMVSTPVATSGPQQVSVAFSPATDNVGVTGYRLFSDADGYASSIASGAASPIVVAQTALQTHAYKVAAYDAAGNQGALSPASNSVTIGMGAGNDTTAPTVPTALVASPRSQGALLTWTASTDAVGVTAYKVYRDGVLVQTLGNVLTFTDAGLTNGTVYGYTISALDAAGNESAQSTVSRMMPGSIFDGFQRADAANLGATDSGQTYLYPANSGISEVISSKAARQVTPYTANTTTTVNKSQNIIPAPAADFTAAFRVKAVPSSAANGSGGFQFRTSADGNVLCYVSFRQSSSALGCSLVKITASGATTGGPSVITAGTTVLAAGDLVKLVVSGTTASVYVNGSATAAVTGTIPSNTNLYLGPYTSGAFDGAIDLLSVV